MTLTRRRFVTTAGAAAAAVALPLRGWSATTLELNGTRIDSLSDGHLVLPGEFALGDMPAEQAAPVLAEFGLSTDRFEPPCNVTLMRDGTNTVLFDVGSGPNFMPTAGKLLDALDALDLTPENITHVVFTHGHPDHLWGLLDDFDDPLFYDAEYLIGQTEFDYWMDDETVNTIVASRQSMAVGAKNRLEVIADTVQTFGDGEEILPGIAARGSFGHTPGHMSFEIRAGSASVMVVGDAIVNHHLAFARPDWHSGSDQDAERGAATRVKLLDQLASEQMRLVGFHLPDGGIGRAEKAADGYRFIPGDA